MKGAATIARNASIAAFALLTLATILAPVVAPHDPRLVNMSVRLEEPGGSYLFGTDGVGRDVLSRALYGGRHSLLLALAATASIAFIAIGLGTLAGYCGGWVDDAVTVVTGLFHGVPGIAVLIAIAGLLGPGAPALVLGLVIVSWPTFSRVVRTEVLRVATLPFVEALRFAGASHPRIVLLHILPNIAGPILVLMATRMAASIVAVASLSFLGLGVQPPTPDWGIMIRDALPYMRTRPLLLLIPGLCVLTATYGLGSLAELARSRFDVRRLRAVVS